MPTPLYLQHAASVSDPALPRPEHPRPQFFRPDWMNLNGVWEFEIDAGDSGLERGLQKRPLNGSITVPFCPESELSGIGNKDFMSAVWYRRVVRIPAGWQGKRVLLHVQACDYDTTVWINGQEAATHRGGFTPFSLELTRFTQPGDEAVILIRARDAGYEMKAGGKQKLNGYHNYGCHYYRTTGIWQTVWMEAVGQSYLQRPRITPHLAASAFEVTVPVAKAQAGQTIRAVLRDGQGVVAEAVAGVGLDFAPVLRLAVPAERVRLWQPGDGFLYDLELTLCAADGVVADAAHSYAGLRGVALQGHRFLVNGKSVFQRQVLDQGYYPDGIMTAPTDAALRADIELSLAAGFNAARLHQKVFEERFLFHADCLGYLVWGEFGDWGAHYYDPRLPAGDPRWHHAQNAMHQQWAEALLRDYSHPCIIGWCPLNETTRHKDEGDRINSLDDLTRGLFWATKAADATRPVLDASGYSHRVYEVDIYDCHNYTQDPQAFRAEMDGIKSGAPYVNDPNWRLQTSYAGQPYFCSEFGGIKWSLAPDPSGSWGYGDAPKTEEEFFARFKGLCDAQLDNPLLFGYCYTQLTDVCQEQNGVYCYDRSPKFPAAKFCAIQQRKAAIED